MEKVINTHPGSMKERTLPNKKNGLKAHSVRRMEINIKVKSRNSLSINIEKENQLVVFERGHRGAFHDKSDQNHHNMITLLSSIKLIALLNGKTEQDSVAQPGDSSIQYIFVRL